MLDLIFIRSLIERGVLLEFFSKVSEPDKFFEERAAKEIWKFLRDYYFEYAQTPSLLTIQGKFNIELPDAPDEPQYYFSEIQDRFLGGKINEIAVGVSDQMKKGTPSKEIFFSLRNTVMAAVVADDAFDITAPVDATETWSRYLDNKQGNIGIPTPWVTMNAWTRGFFQKDMSFIVGRTGLGKSWMCLLLSRAAIYAGIPTLLISCEMTQEDMWDRFRCIDLKIPYGGFKQGKLSFEDEVRLSEAMKNYQLPAQFMIRDGSRGLKSSDLEEAIMMSKAQLIVIDSVYRVKASKNTKDRFENMALVADEIKSMAQLYNKSIICSTQLNRAATQKKTDDLSTEDIAMSDVIGWNSTNIFAIGRESKDEGERPHMRVIPVKVREGANGKEVMRLSWDFSTMNFEEIEDSVQAPKKAAKKKASVGFGDDDDDGGIDDSRW